MVYSNQFGTVDFLPEKFLKSLDPSKKEIGCKISGGGDTALLTYLLAKEISERNLDFIIRPLTLLDSKDRGIVTQMIINEIKLCFPDVHFEPLRVEPKKFWFETQKDMYEKHNVAFFTNGVNLSPPIQVVGEEKNSWMNKEAPRNIDNLEQFGILNTPEYQPFKHTTKKWTAQMYKDLNLWDSLLPLTRSCLGKPEKTNFHERPCKVCYWCMEKFWAFGIYDHENFY